MNNQNCFNGKINIMTPNISTKFSMMDKIPVNTNQNFCNSLTGNFERSRLSDTYFSQENIQIIQNGIRKGVYDKSNGTIVIDKQEPEKIVSVMRSMYLQYSRNLETNIPKQIEELNKYVLNYCVPNVYSEAIAYLKYREDSSKMYTPMQNPVYSNKTNKTLIQKPWF
tara:strand:- start:478 stop:978 length:501 start_codon:yes stop_codon:yes gene_type:complete